MWLETLHKSENHSEQCPTCGGEVHRRVHGEMYAGSFVHDGKRVEIRRIPDVGYSDAVWLDPLTQYFGGRLYRLWPSETYMRSGGGSLHRHAWASAFGKIPSGCHIHHRDGDTKNNAISNLECLPAKEHMSSTWEAVHKGREIATSTRDAAAAWHGSDAGRLWHKRQAERCKTWLQWKREERACEWCKTPFQALIRKGGHPSKYCSQSCKSAAYHLRCKIAKQK